MDPPPPPERREHGEVPIEDIRVSPIMYCVVQGNAFVNFQLTDHRRLLRSGPANQRIRVRRSSLDQTEPRRSGQPLHIHLAEHRPTFRSKRQTCGKYDDLVHQTSPDQRGGKFSAAIAKVTRIP